MKINTIFLKKPNKKRNTVEVLYRNPDFAKFYYVVKNNELQYFIDKYSFEYFDSIVKAIYRLKTDINVVKEIEKRVHFKTERSKLLLKKLISDSFAGKHLINKRMKKVKFQTYLKKNLYDDEIIRLNKLWRDELNKLLIENFFGCIPKNLESPSTTYLKKAHAFSDIKKLKIIRQRLKLDEKITPQKIELICKDIKHSLRQKYKNQKPKIKELNESSDLLIISNYISYLLPSNPKIKIWFKKFESCINEIKRTDLNRNNAYIFVNTQIELTYLDKNSDFFRSIRFADAITNCINTNRKNGMFKKYINGTEHNFLLVKLCKYIINSQYFNTINAIATIYKDPLTFIIDIKDINLDCIIGFVFGRLAINPKNGKVLIMVSDTYLRQNNQEIIDKVLSVIEEGIGKYIQADGIIYASTTGVKVEASGFKKKLVDVLPLVGVLHTFFGLPVKFMYDDFGIRINSILNIAVYYKNLHNKSLNNIEHNQYQENAETYQELNISKILINLFFRTLVIFLFILISMYLLKFYNSYEYLASLHLLEFFMISLTITFVFSTSKYKKLTWYKYLFINYCSAFLIFMSILFVVGDVFFY